MTEGATIKDDSTVSSRAVLADGSIISVWSTGLSGTGEVCGSKWGDNEILSHCCGTLEVDINGYKGPNQSGKDVFSFYATTSGLIPIGGPNDTQNSLKTCRTKGSCTAWVLIKENMKYPPNGIGWDE